MVFSIGANVSAMSSGGLKLLTIKIQQMTIESTNDNNSTNPAITYSECYAQVFLGDCLELYKNLEPKSIDLILTDLPYGTTACKWDTIIPFDKLWEMVNYLLKPNGAVITTASQPFTSALIMSNPKMFKYEWIWDKVQPTGALTVKKMPMKQHENVLVFYNEQPTYNRQMSDRKKEDLRVNAVRNKNNQKTNFGYEHTGGMIMKYAEDYDPTKVNPKTILTFSKQPTRTKNLHPTQKPIALFDYLLKTYSNEGMTIFDPCMGSGTTGVACKNLNRNFIGIEKDEAYFKIAEQRINARTLF